MNDARITRHEGYAKPLKYRKCIEEAVDWARTVSGVAQSIYRSNELVRSRVIRDEGRE